MTVRVRLAPSPTGNLHIGTARTAVFNFLFARHHQGTFILRIEDTDLERSRQSYTDNILEGLTWLGLTWDEGPFFQSERTELYQTAIQSLLDQGLAYHCYCTPEELDEMRAAQKAKGQAPRYDNRHRNLTDPEKAAFEAEGRTAVIRFKIDDEREINWSDLVRGHVSWQGKDLGGDMVIARAASSSSIGQPLYNLVVVIDDLEMKISHVIRGEDHIGNTPKQILLYEALQGDCPIFGHTPLILNETGQKLSKRDGVTSVSDFQEMGYLPGALINYMALLGWSAPDATQEIFTLEQMADLFSFDRVNRAGAKFDWGKLDWINSQYIHGLEPETLTPLLIPYWQTAGFSFDVAGDRPWLDQISTLIGPSLVKLKDCVEQCEYLFTDHLNWTEEAKELVTQAGVSEALTGIVTQMNEFESFTIEAAQAAIKQVVKAQGINKGLLMRSLRAALTGALKGPDLMQSWELLHQRGVDQARLQTAQELS